MKELFRVNFKGKPGKVTQKDGKTVIERVSVCTAGEALGHGVHLDESFIESVFTQGSEMKIGLKSRFGHPSMCNEALGTYLGRFKNFSMSDDKTQCFADLHLSESAKHTPHGDLHKYVSGLAEDDPNAFATSIVFEYGDFYRKDKDGNKVKTNRYGSPVDFDVREDDLSDELFASCKNLWGNDFVDEPAANPGGLFTKFHGGTIAGQVGLFFDENPDAFEFLEGNPEVVEVLKNHGDKLEAFLTKYKTLKEGDMPKQKPEEDDSLTKKTPEKTPAKEPEKTPEKGGELGNPDKPEKSMSFEEYRRISNKFGAEIAQRVYDDNGNYADAADLYAEQLAEENKALKESLAKAKADEEDGTTFQDEADKKPKLTGLAKAIEADKKGTK